MKPKFNLNDVQPDNDTGAVFTELVEQNDAVLDVFFEDLPRHLVNKLRDAVLVTGCMAWLTNRSILGALSEVKDGCQIVVQKEDWLRPGPVGRDDLQRMYRALRCPNRYQLPTRSARGHEWLSSCADPTCEPVRCMGIPSRGAASPRMHHKFIVFYRYWNADDNHKVFVDSDENYPTYKPYAVWTGSFNATENAARSRENAIFIRSESIANAYAIEWTRTLALSEQLDWNYDYVSPDWRFGS